MPDASVTGDAVGRIIVIGRNHTHHILMAVDTAIIDDVLIELCDGDHLIISIKSKRKTVIKTI
jgi:hypothetical protein